MTESTLPPEPAKNATPDELEADIAATREQLGETIDALEDKLNVSAQAKRRVDETKTRLTDKVNDTVAQATNTVDSVRTQVVDKVSQTRAQLQDKVAQTKAKVTRQDRVAPPASGTYVDAAGGTSVTGSGLPGGQAGVSGETDPFRVDATGSARPRRSSSSTASAFSSRVGQTRADLTRTTSQAWARARQDPRSALPAAGAVSVAVVLAWLVRRSTRKRVPAAGQV